MVTTCLALQSILNLKELTTFHLLGRGRLDGWSLGRALHVPWEVFCCLPQDKLSKKVTERNFSLLIASFLIFPYVFPVL